MTHHASFATSALLPGRFTRLRQIVDLLGQLGQLTEPISTPAGLRAALELPVQVGTLLGIDAAWLAKLQTVLKSDIAFRIVLALVRLALEASGAIADGEDFVHSSEAGAVDVLRLDAGDGDLAIVSSQGLADWLPVVIEIIALLRALRGAA